MIFPLRPTIVRQGRGRHSLLWRLALLGATFNLATGCGETLRQRIDRLKEPRKSPDFVVLPKAEPPRALSFPEEPLIKGPFFTRSLSLDKQENGFRLPPLKTADFTDPTSSCATIANYLRLYSIHFLAGTETAIRITGCVKHAAHLKMKVERGRVSNNLELRVQARADSPPLLRWYNEDRREFAPIRCQGHRCTWQQEVVHTNMAHLAETMDAAINKP